MSCQALTFFIWMPRMKLEENANSILLEVLSHETWRLPPPGTLA
jgi:hypothetical protein